MISPTQAVSKIKPLPIDLETATIAQLQQALSAREVTSAQLVDAYVARIEALDSRGPGLNAVRVLDPRAADEAGRADRERARGRARGPMYGIPVLVKDNIDV
ncbi:MAG: amidase family protein, partial [Actinomadura sp.]